MRESSRRHPYGTATEWRPEHTGSTTAASPSVERSTTWSQARASELRELGQRVRHDDFYSRYGHPNGRLIEAEIASLEGGEGAVAFASGMAAIHAVLQGLVDSGERIAVAHQVYGGTSSLCRHVLPRCGIEVDVFDVFDEASTDAVLARGPVLCWVETPVNPTLRIVDLERLGGKCRAAAVRLACDATFAPAPIQRVLDHGAELAVHSLTKYFGGHSDVLGGIVVANHDLCREVEAFRARTGAILGPDSAWLVHRSLRTHGLRLRAQNEAAAELARRLAERVSADGPLAAVLHPSLQEHPDHRLAAAQMPGGFGAVLTLELRGGYEAAAVALERLRILLPAPSLGGVESLVSIPTDSSHVGLDEAGMRLHGIRPGMLRISVGLEPVSELLVDLEQAVGVRGSGDPA